MKKILLFGVILFAFGLVYQFIVIRFENSFEYSYEINSLDKSFSVLEEYKKNDLEDGYYITIISNDSYEFIFYVENNFNKQKKIIDEISYYEVDDYLCIYPISIKNNNEFEILCSDKNEIYSYDYLNKEIDISSFVSELGLNKYFLDDEEELELDSTFYINNIYDEEYFMIYRYKYLNIYHGGEANSFSFSNTDIYKNELGVYINNYFVIPNISDGEIDKYYIIDCLTKKQTTIKFSSHLSDNIYNIGILDNKLYIFDLDNKKEYEIDPVNKSYEEIGNTSDGFKLYKDGEWINESIKSFTSDKITFSDSKELNYDYDSIYEVEHAYYILDGNKMYKIYKNNLNNRILLLELNNCSNIVVSKDKVYYIKDAYIYRYDKYGVKKLVSNNEFKYNNTNIFSIYNE